MSDYTSTFTEQDGIDDVDAADFSTEFNAIETHIATKEDAANLIDEDDMASDDATRYPTQQSVKAYVDAKTAVLNTKIVNIGDWNMDSTNSVSVAHGIADHTKARSLIVTIRNDTDADYYDFSSADNDSGSTNSFVRIDSTNVDISRMASGIFDTVAFDSTGYNRGWIVIQYTD